MIDVKSEPELRHVLTHIMYAIQALADNCPRVALYELESISEMVLWADDSNEALEADLEGRFRRAEEERLENVSREKELPGLVEGEEGIENVSRQEELPEEEVSEPGACERTPGCELTGSHLHCEPA